MKTAVAQTSIDCYRGLDLSRQQREVLDAIWFLGAPVRNEVADLLGWQTATVSGRVNELIEKRIIRESDEKRTSRVTGKLGYPLYGVENNGGLF